MELDLRRIEGAIDSQVLSCAHVLVAGCGGSVQLIGNLARSGVGRFTLFDPDMVSHENICRTEFQPREIGLSKVAAVAGRVMDINPAAEITLCQQSIADAAALDLSVSSHPIDLVIAATDQFEAQAWLNRWTVANRVAAMFVGLYQRGLGGEVIFWYPGLPCFRCLMGHRYRIQAEARENGQSLDPASQDTTVFDLSFVDAVAGHVALGLLLRGTGTRFGRLIAQLGDRNFLHIKIDPAYALNGRDVIREQLGIPAKQDTFVSWCVAARRDPDHGVPPCPDCVEASHRASWGE